MQFSNTAPNRVFAASSVLMMRSFYKMFLRAAGVWVFTRPRPTEVIGTRPSKKPTVRPVGIAPKANIARRLAHSGHRNQITWTVIPVPFQRGRFRRYDAPSWAYLFSDSCPPGAWARPKRLIDALRRLQRERLPHRFEADGEVGRQHLHRINGRGNAPAGDSCGALHRGGAGAPAPKPIK